MLLEADNAVTAAPIDGASADLAAALAAAGLPTDDLAMPGRVFFRFRDADCAAVGFGGYELLGKDVLVRSVVVSPERRNAGLGREIVALLLREAAAAGATQAFLLTTTARTFFERVGFAVIPRDKAPPAILSTREAAELCPSTAPLLSRTLIG